MLMAHNLCRLESPVKEAGRLLVNPEFSITLQTNDRGETK